MGIRWTVTTPAPDFTGIIGDVAFARGVAEVDEDEHPAALAYFNAQGYKVEKVTPVRARKTEPDPRIAELEKELAAKAAEVDKLTTANTDLAAKLDAAEKAAAEAAKTKPQGGTK